MAELHEALACLRPKDFSDVPTDNLEQFLPEILAKAELIMNSVPPPPNGTPYELSQRTRTDQRPATSAKDLTVSQVRRPPPASEHEELQKSWGKPLKLGNADAATGMSVFKMAGKDRHGAWFSRTSVHEGLGFEKWKYAMQREFEESLQVQGGPGEGNVRGIGGDQRLEYMTVDGVGQLQGMWYRRQSKTDGELTTYSVSAFGSVSGSDLTARVHYSPHHLRYLSDRRLKSHRHNTPPFCGCLHTRFSSECAPSS
jgi:hypothetical protein